MKAIDENFNREGITISYPTEVEIDVNAKENDDSGKVSRQQEAREKMYLEEKRFLAEREAVRRRLKEIEEKLKEVNVSDAKVSDLEFEAQAIESELSTFEREG